MMHTLSERKRRNSLPARKALCIDEIIKEIKTNVGRVCAIAAQDSVDNLTEIEKTSVRFRKALRVLPEPFGLAREYMDEALARTAVGGRAELLELLEPVAHIRGTLATLEEILPRTDGQNDDRLQKCSDACESLELLLRQNGLGERLEEMLAIEKHNVAVHQRTVSEISVDESPVRLSPDDRHKMLCEIDELIDEESTRPEALDKIGVLFSDYADGQGFLQGVAYDHVITDLVRYVRMEWDARNRRLIAEGKGKLAERLGTLTDEFLQDWVTRSVDPDGDGCITEEEAMAGFEKCVNEIDPPKTKSP